ncbi:hypothetical protein SAMN05216553_108311 [Lentzea fradiae]|uniref:Uncharacterized protein n=1 Tax=Lentzea fradiae TaxID=200378 RepID=A0A1G7UN07_9PSEU|nr:hypothetical protein [Lentzea fradiae]SDG48985.1 hypothetical protein SAMN05216553_108311 [Lentzea fradiae]
MFTSRKPAAATLVSLAFAALAFLGLSAGTASADTASPAPVVALGPGDCPQDTHWSADLLTCVEDTHW